MCDRYVHIWRGPRKGTDSAHETRHNNSNTVTIDTIFALLSCLSFLPSCTAFRLIVDIVRPLPLLDFGLSDPASKNRVLVLVIIVILTANEID
jgi:hypothetical protein